MINSDILTINRQSKTINLQFKKEKKLYLKAIS